MDSKQSIANMNNAIIRATKIEFIRSSVGNEKERRRCKWLILRVDPISGIGVVLIDGISTWLKASMIVKERYSDYNGIQKIMILPYYKTLLGDYIIE